MTYGITVVELEDPAKKKILERLLVDREQKLETLVTKAENIVRIDRKSGEPVIVVPRSELTDRQLIGAYMIGKYFSNELGLVKTATVTTRELAEKLPLDLKVASARLSELKKEAIVKSISRGEYKIVFQGIEILLDDIRKSMQ